MPTYHPKSHLGRVGRFSTIPVRYQRTDRLNNDDTRRVRRGRLRYVRRGLKITIKTRIDTTLEQSVT